MLGRIYDSHLLLQTMALATSPTSSRAAVHKQKHKDGETKRARQNARRKERALQKRERRRMERLEDSKARRMEQQRIELETRVSEGNRQVADTPQAGGDARASLCPICLGEGRLVEGSRAEQEAGQLGLSHWRYTAEEPHQGPDGRLHRFFRVSGAIGSWQRPFVELEAATDTSVKIMVPKDALGTPHWAQGWRVQEADHQPEELDVDLPDSYPHQVGQRCPLCSGLGTPSSRSDGGTFAPSHEM